MIDCDSDHHRHLLDHDDDHDDSDRRGLLNAQSQFVDSERSSFCNTAFRRILQVVGTLAPYSYCTRNSSTTCNFNCNCECEDDDS
jgi:hypothetical protein